MVEHYENFPVASCLIPKHLRRAVRCIYWFARYADDIADEGNATSQKRQQQLQVYLQKLDDACHSPNTAEPFWAELAQCIQSHQLPMQPFYNLVSAFRQDLEVCRYPDTTALMDYCRHSACPVGHLVLCLFKANTPENKAHSDRICTALQLTNFLQDVPIDWAKGRLYLPLDSLKHFKVSEQDIETQTLNQNWKRLLKYHIEQVRSLFDASTPLYNQLPGRLGWEIFFTVEGARRVLRKIEQNHYDVFSSRIVLSKWDWAYILLHAWKRWRYHYMPTF